MGRKPLFLALNCRTRVFEAITLKQLGLYLNPIVLLNTRGYWNPWLEFMRGVIAERFMNSIHGVMWAVAETVDAVLPAIAATPAGTPVRASTRWCGRVEQSRRDVSAWG